MNRHAIPFMDTSPGGRLRERICRPCRVLLGSRDVCPMCGQSTESATIERTSPFGGVEIKP